MRYSPARTATPTPPRKRISTPTAYRSAAISPSVPTNSPSAMTRATAPMFLLLICPVHLWGTIAGTPATYPERGRGTHGGALLRDGGMQPTEAHDGRSGARSGRGSGAGPVADGIVAGVPHHPRVLRHRVRGRHPDRGMDRYQARRCRGAAAGAPLVEGHGGAGGGGRGVGDRAVV